jgi:hydroxyacylglutathione hydrolase
MLAAYPEVTIVGGAEDNVQACTMPVVDSQEFEVGGLRIKCLHTPCHTRGHIIYVVEPIDCGASLYQIGRDSAGYQFSGGVKQAMFTGDTIFVGGCGRFFEGQPHEMVAAMEKAMAYPDAWMFCGHEYTLANLKFCLEVEPQNDNLKTKMARAEQERAAKIWTVPSKIAEEMTYNVFMRSCTPHV